MPRRIVALGILLGSLSVSLLAIGCGGDDEQQFANQPTGEFPVEVISSQFKPVQQIAKTYDFTMAVRNSGQEAIPGISVTVDLPGMRSTLAFAYGDRQKGLAMDQRPVWVLEEGYPKLADTAGRGGATTDDDRTFDFGELEPGDTANMVWRLTAVRPGNYRLGWEVSAGLGLDTKAVDSAGEIPRGIMPVRVSDLARLTKVNGRGQVVPLTPAEQARVVEQQESVPDGALAP